MTEGAVAKRNVEIEGLVQSSLKETWESFKDNAALYIIANLVFTIVGALSLGILMGPLLVGFIDIVRKRRRGEAASVGDVFEGLSTFGTSFGAFVLLMLGTFIGMLLLVLPGLIFAFLTAFTFQNIAYRQNGAIDAMKGSIDIVKGHIVPVLVVMIILLVISGVGSMIPFAFILTGPFSLVLVCIAYELLTGSGAASAGHLSEG